MHFWDFLLYLSLPLHKYRGKEGNVMKKDMKDKKKEWFLDMMETFEMPKETLLNVPIISMVGNREIVIENFISIIQYEEEVIRLKTSCGELGIWGKGLKAKSMDSEQIHIKGTINDVSYGPRG